MASSWKKVRNLFWQSGEAEQEGTDAVPAQEISDQEFAELLSQSPHAVPAGQAHEPVDVSSLALSHDGGTVSIDFQEQYDQAGIPDTDEVEQLEGCLSRLDASLPQVSKIAAAQAFLGAIGKDVNAVLEDAARKIKRVRGVLVGKEQETAAALAREQGEIDALQQKVEQHRTRMQELSRELEGLRQACLIEESRLQAARVFFGSVAPGGTGHPAR